MEQSISSVPFGIRVVVILMVSWTFHTVLAASAARESYEAEYFTNVSLPCNFTLHNLTFPGLPIPFKRYWILPNTTVLADTYLGSERCWIEKPNPYTFNLRISAIDDPDFGVYHCIMIWENIFYTASAIRVALNENGPYYKNKLEQFERNVIIGCATAGGVVLIILIGCAICRCRQRKHDRNGGLPDTDHFSPRSNGRQSAYTYEMNSGISKERAPEPRELSPAETYANVRKFGIHSHDGNVKEQSSHL